MIINDFLDELERNPPQLTDIQQPNTLTGGIAEPAQHTRFGTTTVADDIPKPPEVTEPPQIPSSQKEYATYREKVNDILGMTKPAFDAPKAERLKRIAAINSIGDAIKAGFSGYVGNKFGYVPDTRSDITPKALGEYKDMLDKDKENSYRTSLLQAQERIAGFKAELADQFATNRLNAANKAKAIELADKNKFAEYMGDKKAGQRLAELIVKNGLAGEAYKIKSADDAAKLSAQLEAREKDREAANWRTKYSVDHRVGGSGGKGTVLAKKSILDHPNLTLTTKSGYTLNREQVAELFPFVLDAMTSQDDGNGKIVSRPIQPLLKLHLNKPEMLSLDDVSYIFNSPEGQTILQDWLQYQPAGTVPAQTQQAQPAQTKPGKIDVSKYGGVEGFK